MNRAGLLKRLANALSWRVARARRPIQQKALARQLAKTSESCWTDDYVSPHVENWTHLLEDYRDKPGVRMLELGSYEGRSAVWFLKNVLTGPGSHLVCVDAFYESRLELRFDHNIRINGVASRATKVKSLVADYLPGVPRESFDIIYIDASHEAKDVLLDAMLSWYRLKPGGILIFDDYLWRLELPVANRPQMAIDLFLESFAGRYDLLLKDRQVAIRRAPSTAAAQADRY